MRPSSLKPDSRISASKVPKIRPPSAASPVSVSVNVMPSKNRYPSERRMTSKSKLANMRGSLPGDVARNREPALKEAHGHDDDDVDQEIQHRRRREGLEHLKGKFLHRPRLGGQFNQADGEGHRRVLDGREKFGSERRHDDAKRHRQQAITIGL